MRKIFLVLLFLYLENDFFSFCVLRAFTYRYSSTGTASECRSLHSSNANRASRPTRDSQQPKIQCAKICVTTVDRGVSPPWWLPVVLLPATVGNDDKYLFYRKMVRKDKDNKSTNSSNSSTGGSNSGNEIGVPKSTGSSNTNSSSTLSTIVTTATPERGFAFTNEYLRSPLIHPMSILLISFLNDELPTLPDLIS